jgi:serine/threonine protein kinase/type I restriction-modification system DNA methylase subunit
MTKGQILRNRYKILEEISSGGFGETYLAEYPIDLPNATKFNCVVKRLKSKYQDDSDIVERFKQEAALLQNLGQRHAQIPNLIDYFEENREFYLVQEYIEGHDLSYEIDNKWQEEEAIQLLQECLDVLAFIHQEGVIHADIKPKNLIRRNEDGKIILIDFGIVRVTNALIIEPQRKKRKNRDFGTLCYIAPEQLDGNLLYGSDVYALGITVIQALTGSVETNLWNRTQVSVWNRTQVSDRLAEILDKMVHRDYRKRYVDASEVLRDIEQLIASREPFVPGSDRVESLRQLFGYPIAERDPQGSNFWFLRPGENESHAKETSPIAIGFCSELNNITEPNIKTFIDAKEQEICNHYMDRVNENKPVMYLLLPTAENTGRVVLVLPTEKTLKLRNVHSFAWNEDKLTTRFNRLKQKNLKITESLVALIPQVEVAFWEPAKTAQELAQQLAKVSREIEQIIPNIAEAQGKNGYLYELLRSFKRELLPNLKLNSDNEKEYSFADIYAQTIAYGLFTARVFSYTKNQKIDFNKEVAGEQLPETNPFLQKLFKDIFQQNSEELGDELVDAIAEIFGILRAAKMEAILQDFQEKMNQEDIIIRFYEDFLRAYKPQMREMRGVYYTPKPVVSYIVRSVDELLKDKFNKPLGLADSEVMILDPACGTGTFLLHIFELIYQRFLENPVGLTIGLSDVSWSGYVRERLLPRVFGFELLIAPYAICHLKLALYLANTGYQFGSGKRLEVYLTNTLDDAVKKSETLFEEFIAEEASQAAEIKRNKPIMVVVGNPPYSISSVNKSSYINNLMERYKKAVRSERNIQPLSDDYIKFICFAQNRIELTKHGILAFITNNSFLQGLISRGMREELLKTFNNIYFLDLHGQAQETPPQNILADQNVFDIKKGVSLTIAIRELNSNRQNKVYHSEIWGDRQYKYKTLKNNNLISSSSNYSEIFPAAPDFFFVPKILNLNEEYKSLISVVDVFSLYKNGIQSGHDGFATALDRDNLETRIKAFFSKSVSDLEIKTNFQLEDKSGWNLKNERELAFTEGYREEYIRHYFYRPFDYRWIYFSKRTLKRPSKEVMQHLTHSNFGLVVCRQQAELGFRHVFVTNQVGDCNAISIKSREFNYYFPLYKYPDTENPQGNLLDEKLSNISLDFLAKIRKILGDVPTPENIFYYIYAIFHSPTYRSRYAEFLKIDFPRVPLTSNNELFCQLATYGEQLVALHLMESPQLDNLMTEFVEENGACVVAPGHPKYDKGDILINKQGDKFTGVPEDIWNFYIGGYQPCQKWLKDRKGRTLTAEDIQHYQRIVVALSQTSKLMQQIDEAIPGFPIE